MKMDTLVKEVKEQKGLIVAVIAVGLIFGFVVGRALKGEEVGEFVAKKTPVTADDGKITGTVKKTQGNVANLSTIFLTSPQIAGKLVSVDMVNLTENAWVVVREDFDGKMGNILGAQWLPKGTKSPTTVDLLRGTEAGKSYYVVLWEDNGDRIFGIDTDAPMLNKGKMIAVSFTLQ